MAGEHRLAGSGDPEQTMEKLFSVGKCIIEETVGHERDEQAIGGRDRPNGDPV